jgi:DNA polymerase/3'-5' exonuclease PolX
MKSNRVEELEAERDRWKTRAIQESKQCLELGTMLKGIQENLKTGLSVYRQTGDISAIEALLERNPIGR